jgi:hypothetical protein
MEDDVTDETKDLIEKARALLAAATPGPWRASCQHLDGECAATGPTHVVDGYGRLAEEEASKAASYDAELIAFAVNNLPVFCDAFAAEKQRADETVGLAMRLVVEALADCGIGNDPESEDEDPQATALYDAILLKVIGPLAAALLARLHAAESERDALMERLRTTAQLLIESVGADGPCDAEDAARRAVERLHAAEADAAALPAMDAECGRLRAQVDADRQTLVRLTDERDRALTAAVSSAKEAKSAADLLAKVGENAYAWPYGVAWACKEAHRLLTGGPPDGLYVRAPADKPRDLDAEVVAGVQASRTTPEPKP